MKILAWFAFILGLAFLILGFGLLSGNRDLPNSFPQYLSEGIQGHFRWLLGLLSWLSALCFSAGWIVFRRLPGMSWLSLALLLVLIPLYFFGGALVPNFVSSVLALLALAIVIPIVLCLVASLIGGVVRRNRASRESFPPSLG